MAARLAGRGLSRRRVLQAGTAAGVALTMAACGAPVVVERVVVIPTIVEREVIVERPVVTEREVIVERQVVVEQQVVITRLVTPPPTPSPTASPAPRPTVAIPDPTPQPLQLQLRVAVSPALAGENAPDLSVVDTTANVTLEMLDAGSQSDARLLARAVAGDLPDILIGIPGGLVTALDALETLAPLDAELETEHGFLTEMLALGERDHGLVGIPVSAYPTYLLASRRRLQAAGVAEVGATYVDLGEAARRLTDPETFTYGFGVVAGLPELETVAGSAGSFPGSEAALNAWQWYADQWLRERVSPPPSAWDGQGAAGEAILSGRVALTIAHGRALNRLAALPPDARDGWKALPLPGWPGASRRVPMAGAFVVAGHDGGAEAAHVAIALAGSTRTFDAGPGTPAWTLALDGAAARLGLRLEQLLEARDAWTMPLVERADWRARVDDLDTAIHRSLTMGQPAAESIAEASG